MIRRTAVLCLTLALLGPAAAQSMATHRADSAGNPADEAFVRAMREMMTGMHRNMPTGDVDADFVRMMLPHHQAAVDMAKAELRYGTDAELQALAQAIVTDQEKEIAIMKAWQDRHAPR